MSNGGRCGGQQRAFPPAPEKGRIRRAAIHLRGEREKKRRSVPPASRRLGHGFKGHAHGLRGFAGIVQPLESNDPALAILHQDHFLTRFLARCIPPADGQTTRSTCGPSDRNRHLLRPYPFAFFDGIGGIRRDQESQRAFLPAHGADPAPVAAAAVEKMPVRIACVTGLRSVQIPAPTWARSSWASGRKARPEPAVLPARVKD